jgi:hypothetical protein
MWAISGATLLLSQIGRSFTSAGRTTDISHEGRI